MIRFAKTLSAIIDHVNEFTGRAVAWLTAALVLVVTADVFSRYCLNRSVVAIQEVEWHLFSAIFLIGAGFTLKHNRHVRVDVFYSRLTPRGQALINVFGCLVFLVPFCAIVVWAGSEFAYNSFSYRETSPDPGGLPARYVIKAIIPVGFLLVLLQGVSCACSSAVLLLKRE